MYVYVCERERVYMCGVGWGVMSCHVSWNISTCANVSVCAFFLCIMSPAPLSPPPTHPHMHSHTTQPPKLTTPPSTHTHTHTHITNTPTTHNPHLPTSHTHTHTHTPGCCGTNSTSTVCVSWGRSTPEALARQKGDVLACAA